MLHLGPAGRTGHRLRAVCLSPSFSNHKNFLRRTMVTQDAAILPKVKKMKVKKMKKKAKKKKIKGADVGTS